MGKILNRIKFLIRLSIAELIAERETKRFYKKEFQELEKNFLTKIKEIDIKEVNKNG